MACSVMDFSVGSDGTVAYIDYDDKIYVRNGANYW